jgi:hypothetical protein
MDPIWATRRDMTKLKYILTPDQFLNADAATKGNLFTLDEFQLRDPNAPGSTPSYVAYPENRLMQIAAVPVYFDYARRLWYSDIQLDPGVTYSPFVRLALVRFQPNAITEVKTGKTTRDAHVSRVVMADFVQLAPNRAVSITELFKEKKLAISVTGIAYRGDAKGYSVGDVHVSLEEKESDSASGWAPVPGKARTLSPPPPPRPGGPASGADATDVITWTGEIPLDHEPRRGRQRIVIREFERYRYESQNTPRMVFADAIEL